VISLLKKSALSWLRPQMELETPQKWRIWCPIWDESVHRGSFSTGCDAKPLPALHFEPNLAVGTQAGAEGKQVFSKKLGT
jgi:hypothetical protein